MKKRLHDKQAGVAILAVLIMVSIINVILRATILREDLFSVSDLGEPLSIALFSAFLIILVAKKRDRLFYVCCGMWLGYFVIKQAFGLPGMIATIISMITAPDTIVPAVISVVMSTLGMIGIVAIGVLIIEYMDDGTICNRAFNVVCMATVIVNFLHALICVYAIAIVDQAPVTLALLNNITSTTMVFLFTFYAYDIAKAQLKNVGE